MRQCPKCGREFGFWARAIGEHREHMKTCEAAAKKDDSHYYEYSANCRSCPAECFTDEEIDMAEGRFGKGPE